MGLLVCTGFRFSVTCLVGARKTRTGQTSSLSCGQESSKEPLSAPIALGKTKPTRSTISGICPESHLQSAPDAKENSPWVKRSIFNKQNQRKQLQRDNANKRFLFNFSPPGNASADHPQEPTCRLCTD